MEVKTNTKPEIRQTGQASKLKRYGASPANHKNYSRREFILTLADTCQMLNITKKSEETERKFDENGEEIEDPLIQITWDSLKCPRCLRAFEDTRSLVKHLVDVHGRPDDKTWYPKTGLIGVELNKLFESAVKKQLGNSHVKRKFNNTNDFLTCPADSSLAPFLMMRHLQIYLQEMPASILDGISLKVQSGDTSSTVIFSFQKIDRIRSKIKRNMARKALLAEFKKLERQCLRDRIEYVDVCSKTSNDSEEFQMLAQALKLSPTCSHEEIMEKINEMKAKHEELNSVYSKNVKPNGQVMSKEEKRLISSLTTDMVKPVFGKRKTTYKNPSELIPVVKRQKKSTPS